MMYFIVELQKYKSRRNRMIYLAIMSNNQGFIETRNWQVTSMMNVINNNTNVNWTWISPIILYSIMRENLSMIYSSTTWWFNVELTCLAHAAADGIDDDKDDEYRREDNADYGSARYQRALMLQHAGIYTLKDDKSISFLNIFIVAHVYMYIASPLVQKRYWTMFGDG